MLKFCSICSGSSGNCLFVASNNTKILIDCGISCKKATEGLENIGYNMNEIDAIFVTHEHSDHTQGIGTVSKKYNIPIYANIETWQAMRKQMEKINKENIKYFENDKEIIFNDISLFPFSTPHDAANSCGFNINNGKKMLSIATDIGHMNDVLLDRLKESEFIFLESNYDPEILKISRYPAVLRARIAGDYGHLSNHSAGETISYLKNKKELKEVMLGHLSKENNFPELAYQTVVNKLIEDDIDVNSMKISVADRYNVSKIVNL